MKELKRIFEQWNIPYGVRQEGQFLSFMDQVLKQNEHVNLTAITDREEFIRKHYIDSLLCAGAPEFRRAEIIADVGTGIGFPGIPLAIAFPEKKFVLMDSLNKRIRILRQLCEALEISNVEALHGRAEELARQRNLREAFDVCVSRAVANMSVLSEYCLPFVKVGGTFIAFKGPDCQQEVADAAAAIEALGGRLDRQERMEQSGFPYDHRLIFIRKERNTTSKYPRKPGTPSKEPIK